jgi:hypothetical protein
MLPLGSDSKNTLYCSFCGKNQYEVRKLIAGPTVFICDECVDLCVSIVRAEFAPEIKDKMADQTILQLAYERATLLQQAVFPHPRMPPGVGADRDRETYRRELVEELTTRILSLTPRNDREAIIQLECIVDRWKPRLEGNEQRPGPKTPALHQLVEQLIELLRGISADGSPRQHAGP